MPPLRALQAQNLPLRAAPSGLTRFAESNAEQNRESSALMEAWSPSFRLSRLSALPEGDLQ